MPSGLIKKVAEWGLIPYNDHASSTAKAVPLLPREKAIKCLLKPIAEVSFAYFLFRHNKRKTEMKNHLCLLIIRFAQNDY